jgi:hypothetical protein
VCTATLKASGGDGTCGPAKADLDPRDRCPSDANYPASCKADGLCGGGSTCRASAVKGTACAKDAACADEGKSFEALTCDGDGSRVKAKTLCGDFRCDPVKVACLTECATATDCTSEGVWYNAGACEPTRPNGEACTSYDARTSGLCKDGSCRTACSSPGDCDASERCDAGACMPRFDSGALCTASDACKSGFRTDALCCEAASCGAYRCGKGGVCGETCDSNADCAEAHRCTSERTCEPATPGAIVVGGCALTAGALEGLTTEDVSRRWLGVAVGLLGLAAARRRVRQAA